MAYRAGMAFEPRTMVAQRRAFGRVSGDIAPADGIEPADPRYRAAVMQHALAIAVKNALAYSEVSLGGFLASIPESPGLSLDRQRRVLRGETSATYTDLAFWAGHFPVIARVMSLHLAAWAESKPSATGLENRTPPPARPPLR